MKMEFRHWLWWQWKHFVFGKGAMRFAASTRRIGLYWYALASECSTTSVIIQCWLLTSKRLLGYHYLAMSINMVLFIVSRHTVGRMRPNYLDRCKPNVGYFSCNTTAFITDYECTGNKTRAQLETSRQSFFSGHASISMCVSTFVTVSLRCW
jgi:hypothetical protein